MMKKWRVVGFKHPDEKKSLIYRQNLNNAGLLKAINDGIRKGCNLFSIRGFDATKPEGT